MPQIPFRSLSLALLALPCAGVLPAAAWAQPTALFAPAEDAAALVRTGREHLDAGRFDAAREAFAAALELAPSPAHQLWVWRADVGMGQHDRVLGEASSKRRSGERSPELDFAVGMALLAKCELQIAQGSSGQVGLLLDDALSSLKDAMAASEGKGDLGDGYVLLARAAHLSGKPEEALVAARRAQELFPDAVEPRVLRGKAALAQVRAKEDAGDAAAAKELLAEAVEALGSAVERLGDAKKPAQQTMAAETLVQLGYAHEFAKEPKLADEAYVSALAHAPDAVDLGALHGVLGAERFLGVLERGAAAFAKRHGARDPRDATLLWWLGWANLTSDESKRLPAAEEAFLAAVEKWPAYVNSWYYLFRVRYNLENWLGAKEALERYSQLAEDGLIDTLRRGGELELARVEFLVARFVNAGPERLPDAAWVSEFLARATPPDATEDVARHWNNAGLFWRDAGDSRGGRNSKVRGDEERYAPLAEMYERSWKAYSKALELDPENPAFLNDGAVLLHYNLQRDYELALEMYAKATVEAEKRLAGKGLSAELRSIYQLALRDSVNNRKLLEAQIEKEKRDREKEQEKKGT